MTDEDKFLARVLAEPADDTHRLVYADWLDERAGEPACPRCDGRGLWLETAAAIPGVRFVVCRECRGKVDSPPARAARAEFIRLQCDLARFGWRTWPGMARTGETARAAHARLECDCTGCQMAAREATLVHLFGRDWLGGAGPGGLSADVERDGALAFGPGLKIRFRRGFVGAVEAVDLAAVLGAPCQDCDGGGREMVATYESVRETACGACGGALVSRDDTPAGRGAKWCAGCWRTIGPRHVGWEPGPGPCRACAATGRTRGLRDLLRRHPIEAVACGRQPCAAGPPGGGISGWGWYTGGPRGGPDALPAALFARLAGGRAVADGPERWRDYPTYDAAMAAFAAAVVDLARSEGP